MYYDVISFVKWPLSFPKVEIWNSKNNRPFLQFKLSLQWTKKFIKANVFHKFHAKRIDLCWILGKKIGLFVKTSKIRICRTVYPKTFNKTVLKSWFLDLSKIAIENGKFRKITLLPYLVKPYDVIKLQDVRKSYLNTLALPHITWNWSVLCRIWIISIYQKISLVTEIRCL